ncbi:hypothetical protein AB5J52_20015 [Streptomyces sp. R39]|uniref:PQ-loop repeat-containing protein n=1 Tax=Streptomyces sp. R39 TaxID=3238631 RepID=A0AB39QPI4_9ACTN
MDIPGWSVWIALGLTVLQAPGLVPVIRRLRGTDSAVRSQARLDLMDVIGSLLLFGGLSLSLTGAESWFWLTFAGIALMAAFYAAQGIHWLRSRRRPTA